TAINRWQEDLTLLLRAPHEDRRRAESPAAVVIGRQREVEAVDLLFEDDRVVDVEPAAAVFRRRSRMEPALRAELLAEITQLKIELLARGVARRRGDDRLQRDRRRIASGRLGVTPDRRDGGPRALRVGELVTEPPVAELAHPA